MTNPFTPNFGQVPCQIAGRKDIISQLDYAYENAPGDPGLTTIFVGARGTGKTALLSYYSRNIQNRGWISVDVSCMPGMLEDIYEQSIRKTSHLVDNEKYDSKITKSIEARLPILKAGIEVEKAYQNSGRNWRSRMTDLIEALNSQDIGLLITIDEVNPNEEEMIAFASIYQMFIREERKIALLMAGLPHSVSLLLKNKQVSFLRRASQSYLKKVDDYEIEDAFVKTIEIGGKRINKDAIQEAAKNINGFPFMFQLLGYRAFELAENSVEISLENIKKGTELAFRDLATRVIKATIDEISDMGIKFLLAMCEDEDYSNNQLIAKRLNKDTNYIATYRKRLLDHGVIENIDKNNYSFAIPYTREYLVDTYAHKMKGGK